MVLFEFACDNCVMQVFRGSVIGGINFWSFISEPFRPKVG